MGSFGSDWSHDAQLFRTGATTSVTLDPTIDVPVPGPTTIVLSHPKSIPVPVTPAFPPDAWAKVYPFGNPGDKCRTTPSISGSLPPPPGSPAAEKAHEQCLQKAWTAHNSKMQLAQDLFRKWTAKYTQGAMRCLNAHRACSGLERRSGATLRIDNGSGKVTRMSAIGITPDMIDIVSHLTVALLMLVTMYQSGWFPADGEAIVRIDPT